MVYYILTAYVCQFQKGKVHFCSSTGVQMSAQNASRIFGICGNMETDKISIRNAKFGILDAQSKMVNIIYVALLMFKWEAKMSEVFFGNIYISK